MIIIKFKDGSDWYKANWVFRQLAKDTSEAFPNDAILNLALEEAQAFGALYPDSMEDAAAAVILMSIGKVAKDTLEGSILGLERAFSGDDEGRRMYLQAISELVEMLKKREI